MIGAGDFLIACQCAALPPAFGDGLALTQEFARFLRADDSVERASGRHAPVKRRHPPRFGFIEPQVLILRYLHQRQEIEHAGDGISRGHQVRRRIRGKGLPVLCDHARRQMPAGGMPIDANALAPLAPQHQAGGPQLRDDIGDRDMRAEIISGDGHRDAARIRAGRQLGKHRRIERTPPAAVDKHGERCLVVVLGRKQIDGLAQRGAVSHREPGVVRGRAVGRPVALPAGENLRMVRHAGAVVVFNLVVDRQHQLPAGF